MPEPSSENRDSIEREQDPGDLPADRANSDAAVSGGQDEVDHPVDPPTHPWRIVRSVGPGLIVAGSIVGSGELIATTKTGAEAGFSLLWLIILGCVVKVFAQIELGRYAIISGKTTLRRSTKSPDLA